MKTLEIGDTFTVKVVEHTDCRACSFYEWSKYGDFCNKGVPLLVGEGGCNEHGTMFRIVDVSRKRFEPAIEDIFRFNNRAFVCIERNGGDCKGCAFNGDVESCASFNCQYEGRRDCTDVFFKEVKED